jgi:quercetin dioxygenase-like cupin family protein
MTEQAMPWPRLVVTGEDSAGRSSVVFDGPAPCHGLADGAVTSDVWQVDKVPDSVAAAATHRTSIATVPPTDGLKVSVTIMPPDGGDVQWGQTDTVEIVTVVSGEIHVLLESAETLLRAGDSFVERGTMHAWANRTSKSAVLVSTMVSATREPSSASPSTYSALNPDQTPDLSSVSGFAPRLVVSGLDAEGLSTIVYDGDQLARATTAVSTVVELWRVDRVPTEVLKPSTSAPAYSQPPPDDGLMMIMAALPPDSEWATNSAAYAEALSLSGIPEGERTGKVQGFHQTDTVDVVTVISGEVWLALDEGEVRLTPGDTIVQRGTNHAWMNRTEEPTVFVLVMASAIR